MSESATRFFFDARPREIDTGTARLPCRSFGSGPALLLVHGFPLSGFTWRKVLPALAKHHTCYVPDLPGMGESQWTDATDFSFPGQGRTLKALVDRLGLERYSVLAQDTGGTFARYLVLEDLRRLVQAVARVDVQAGGIDGEQQVGLEVHEPPSVSSHSSEILRKGMVFTIEPGIYLAHFGGVRIEDMVLVTHSGCEVLTRSVPRVEP